VGEVVDGDELDEELDEREGVGEAEDSVLTVVEELVSCEEACCWMEEWWATWERVSDFSRLGRIWAETSDFLRWLRRSLKSLKGEEKSLIVGF